MGTAIAHGLIGNTDKRSHWIGKTDGTLPTYPGPIPISDVESRLFDWEAISVPTGNFIPVRVEEADLLIPTKDGKGSIPVKAVVNTGAQAIVRSDDFTELGRFKLGYRIHDYKQWLIYVISEILGNNMCILSALTMKNGAQAAIEIGLDEALHDSKSGLDFWPFILAYTSMDGSLATTFSAFSRVLRCDNMFRAISREAAASGRQSKFRHTINSLSENAVSGMHSTIGLLERQADGMVSYVNRLAAVPMSRPQWIKVMDIIAPPAPEDSTKAKVTKMANRREQLDDMYANSDMVAPWVGTAFGGLQAVSSFRHNVASVRGATRLERVYDRTIRGEMAEGDLKTLEAMSTVLGRDLISVN